MSFMMLMMPMMSGHLWLTDAQIERLRPFFPKSRGLPWLLGSEADQETAQWTVVPTNGRSRAICSSVSQNRVPAGQAPRGG